MSDNKLEKEKLIIEIDKTLLNLYVIICLTVGGGMVSLSLSDIAVSNLRIIYLVLGSLILFTFVILALNIFKKLNKHKRNIIS